MTIHSDALDRYAAAYDADLPNRIMAEDDMRMLTVDQWDEDARKVREADNRPCVTVNGLSAIVRTVTGQIRDLNPAIRVLAADGAASTDTAEIMEGMIRSIEYAADAPSVYEAAAESAAACGIGHWRVRADYVDGATFDQELIIERIHNPFAVFWDPAAKDSTRKDARYCFIVEQMKRKDFESAYPKKSADGIGEEAAATDVLNWSTGDTVMVAEYFWVEEKEYKIGLIPESVDIFGNPIPAQVVRDPKPPMNVTRTRTVKEPYVRWAKISGTDILEGPVDIPSRYIPVVSVTGEEWHVGDAIYRSSVVRFAKDAQRLYNYARSTAIEIMMLQPKAPYLATPQQVAGLEPIWNEANRKNRPYLLYNPDDNAPPPSRVPPPIPSSAVIAETQIAAEDMKRTTGIYDASLGARSNETSGVAIQRRQSESQNSTSVYADNMVKAVVQTGKVLVDMIARVYDTKRVVRILGADDQEQMETINDVIFGPDGAQPVNDVTVGRYDVRISVGPSYATKRQEAREGMLGLLNAMPVVGQAAPDLIVRAQDWPDADKVADRVAKILPPGIVEKDDPTPEEQQAMMQQQQAAQQQEAARQQEAATAAREAEAKAAKAEADAKKAASDAKKAAIEADTAELELAAKTGRLDELIRGAVSQEVIRTLQGVTQQPPRQVAAFQGP